MKNSLSRKTFCQLTSAAFTGVVLTGSAFASEFAPANTNRPISVFSKCLHFLDYDTLGEIIAKIGFDGADLTVRPDGHVLPENVKTDLPRAFNALTKAGVGIPMIVTAITDTDDKYTEQILGTAANLGIKYYRTGWLNYDPQKTIQENLGQFKRIFEKLEKINQKFGICGGYQNHSGKSFGSPLWDLHPVLKDFDPQYLGVQFDIRHATVEGANSWPLGLNLLAPWIKTTDIKDFIWEKDMDGKWIEKNIPFGQGMVNFKEYFKMVKKLKIEGPVSIHYEYGLGGAEHGNRQTTMDQAKIFEFLKNDLSYLKGQFDKYL